MSARNTDPSATLEALRASEIPFSIDTFVVGYFGASLGDPANGVVAEFASRSLNEVAAWLADAALEHFPQSDFAKSQARERRPNTTFSQSGRSPALA